MRTDVTPPSTDATIFDGGPNLIVKVLDSSGPIGGAWVLASDSHRQSSVSVEAGEDGVAELFAQPGLHNLCAGSEHGVSPTVTVLIPEQGSVDLSLEVFAHSTISGTVVDPEGYPVPNARIVSLSTAVGLSWEGAIHALSSTKLDSFVVHSDPSGRFELPVPPGAAVELLAGAPGLAMEIPVSATPGEVGVTLSTSYLYAACARFEVPEAASGWDWTAFQGGISRSGPSLQRLPDQRSVALTGASSEFSRLRTWPDLNVFVITDRRLAGQESVRLSGRLPGFEPILADVPLEPLDETVTRQIIPLVNLSPGRGSVVVRFEGMAIPPIPPPPGNGSRGTLYLMGDEGTFDCPISGIYSGDVHISGIPAGSYRAVFQYDSGQVTARPEQTNVRADQASAIVIPFPSLGSVEFDLRRADGSPAVSRTVLTLSGPLESQSAGQFDYYLPGPPYVADLLPQGTYELKYWISGGSSASAFRFQVGSDYRKSMPIYHPK